MKGDLSNTPVFYTVTAEILSCLFYLCELHFPKQKKKFVMLLLIMVAHITYFIASDWIYSKIGIFFMAGTSMILYMYFLLLTDIEWRQKIYYTIQSLILAEFMASFAWLVSILIMKKTEIRMGTEVITMLFIYIVILLFLWLLGRKGAYVGGHEYISTSSLLAGIAIAFSIYITSGIGMDYARDDLSGQYGMAMFEMRTLIDFAGVAMLYAHNLQLFNTQIMKEKYAISALLDSQKRQYQISQECIDMVNLKYHDLKQQIIHWKANADTEESQRYLKELTEQVSALELKVQCGNTVLDTILTEKTLLCKKKGIQLSLVIEGEELGFLAVDEICSVFGNALDNAIEYEEKIKEKQKRLIHVTVHRVNDFLLLKFENYCEDLNVVKNGFPETTKKDKQFHGYGLKSIQHVANHYNGQMQIEQEDNWFKVKVLLPVPKDSYK